MSRSETIPTIRPSSTTGSAPIRFSPSLPTASLSDAWPAIVSTALPLLWRTAAIVMARLLYKDSPLRRLDSPTSRGQREAMPIPDPVPSPRGSMKRRFWRIFKLLVLLSVVIAAIAVVLVTQGEGEIHASLIIATALGIGLTVLLGTSLMTLVFLSADSGHDDAAGEPIHHEEEE